MKYTFEELLKLNPTDLAKIKEEKANELSKVRQDQMNTIASILFYQKCIDEEKHD